MAERKIVVTRTEFNHWLSTEKELLETLNEAEIDLSCKSDLFDVLDADLSGELEFEEMIDGLLKCRGPASKTDIIAIRLKTRLLVRMMTQVCEKLGIDEGWLTAKSQSSLAGIGRSSSKRSLIAYFNSTCK